MCVCTRLQKQPTTCPESSSPGMEDLAIEPHSMASASKSTALLHVGKKKMATGFSGCVKCSEMVRPLRA